MPERCYICDGDIEPGQEVDLVFGVAHMESTEECMTEGERAFRKDCANLDRIRNEFSRKGFVNVDHFIWVVEKLAREWELTPERVHEP